MNEKMPRTPFSTPLSGSAREAELRLKNIFSGPKKRPPVLFLALMFAACLLCGNLVSCQQQSVGGSLSSAAPDLRQAGASHLLRCVQDSLFRTQTVSLGEWEGKPLSLELVEHKTEWSFSYQIDRVNVLLDGAPIQTLTAPELLPTAADNPFESWADWTCYGLFDYSPYFEEGAPIVLDLNFDGHMDFGLMGMDTVSRNIPYVFYLWDPERVQFDCFSTFNIDLKADPEARQLIERVYGGNEGDDTNWYAWEDGGLVLVRREEEDWWNYHGSTYHTYIYVRENGRMVQKEDEVRPYPG